MIGIIIGILVLVQTPYTAIGILTIIGSIINILRNLGILAQLKK